MKEWWEPSLREDFYDPHYYEEEKEDKEEMDEEDEK